MNILFDFDGTLADSLNEAVEAANVFLKLNKQKPLTTKEIRQYGIKHILRSRKISKFSILLFIFIWRKRVASLFGTLDTFPALPKTLKTLSQKHTLGIITSNSADNVKKFLQHHGMQQYFTFIESEFSLFGKHKKISKLISANDLDRKLTVYVGDETRDIAAAHKAGVRAISITWGYEDERVLRKGKPDKIVTKPIQLLKL